MYETETLRDRVRRFFFAEEVPYGLALCRIFLPIVLMGMVLPRWYVCRELYSADGATGQLSVGYGYGEMLPEFSGTVVAGLYALMVFAMVSLSVGWMTRVSCLASFVLFTYFSMLDCVSTMTKYSVIVSHVLFILSLSECGSLWSIDAWLARRRRNLDPTKPKYEFTRFPAWPRRLLQLHIGCVYFGAAMTKIHTPAFFSGDQLQYWMLTHLNFKHPIGELLSLYPILLMVMSYVTAVWEVVFIFCCWKGSLRNYILPIGILFHFMTSLTLGLLMFPMVCYCTYLSFIDEDDMQVMGAWMRRQCRRFRLLQQVRVQFQQWREFFGERPNWKWRGWVSYAAAVPILAFLGVEAEYHWDVYGERRPEGRHQLVAIDPELARQFLAPVTPQRVIDKFFAVDIGTFLVGDLLANRRTSFLQGETLIAQCNLVPPHEDMAIECKIRDADFKPVHKGIIAVATREMFRVNINYPIPENLTPGEYVMTIETAGNHVMQKKFQVLPRKTVAAR